MSEAPDFPPFRPFPGLGSGVLMTAAGALPRREPAALVESAVDEVLAGDGENRIGVRVHERPEPDAPWMILAHGLVGDVGSPYVVGTAAKAFARGFHVVRMNARNCGGTEHLAAESYHGGVTGDLLRLVRHLIDGRGATRVCLVGFSLGGNMVLKLAGELGDDAPAELIATASLSPCIDFGAAADRMNASAFGRACQRRFLRSLRGIVRRRKELFEPALDVRGLDRITTIREFDDRYTAPMGGFDGVEHYYAEASGLRVVDRVRVPSLLVAADDDPLVPTRILDRPRVRENSALQVLRSPHGGHVAFLGAARAAGGAGSSDPDRRWGENRLVQFCVERARARGWSGAVW